MGSVRAVCGPELRQAMPAEQAEAEAVGARARPMARRRGIGEREQQAAHHPGPIARDV